MFATRNDSGFRMTFANGWAVSVQWREGNYAGDRDGLSARTAEVAVLKPDGEFDGDVMGWQSPNQVAELMAQVMDR